MDIEGEIYTDHAKKLSAEWRMFATSLVQLKSAGCESRWCNKYSTTQITGTNARHALQKTNREVKKKKKDNQKTTLNLFEAFVTQPDAYTTYYQCDLYWCVCIGKKKQPGIMLYNVEAHEIKAT